MFVDYKGNIFSLLGWQWKVTTALTLASAIVVALDRYFEIDHLHLSTLPLAVVGGAIGIFVSFRTNAGYDRWWEGRRLWGGLVNLSRHFATQVLVYLPESALDTRRDLVRRHIAYVHVLRCSLRGQDPRADARVAEFMDSDDARTLRGSSNLGWALLHRQHEVLAILAREGVLEERRLQSLDETLRLLLDVQGGCERIQKTPFPHGYGFIAERLIWAYGVLLPLGMVESLGWLSVPLSVLVCLSFQLIAEVGRVLENPFTMFWPALPLSALSTTIEINLRERLGETDLPPLPRPDAKGILM